MKNQPMELPLEKELNLRIFAGQVQHMSREQAQQSLLLLYEEMLKRETIYQDILKQAWQI